MTEGIIKYQIDNRVDAFSSMRGAVLPYDVILGDQVHDIKTTVIKTVCPDPESLKGTDALITNIKGLAIGVRTADCIPILLYDPVKNVVAAIHAGWKGTLRRIVNSAISQMILEYGSIPINMKAAIGPGISLDSFQVGEEIPMAFKTLGFPIERIYRWMGGKVEGNPATGHHIDLKEANRWMLENSGIRPENIQDCGIDTFKEDAFFSARRDGNECGRIITAIKLL